MIEADIFASDERIELLDGERHPVAAIAARHAYAVRRLLNLLAKQIGDGAIIDAQNPISLGEKSLPQPDILVLRDRGDVATAYPSPRNVLIVIEVADSSVNYDRNVKFPRYAAAGILEAWLVDLNANVIERHSDPRDGIYHQIVIADASETVSSTILSEVMIPVAIVLDPGEQQ